MIVTKDTVSPEEEKEWENPKNPEAPSDDRENEQAQRLFEEAQRQKENLTDTDEEQQ